MYRKIDSLQRAGERFSDRDIAAGLGVGGYMIISIFCAVGVAVLNAADDAAWKAKWLGTSGLLR